MLRLTRSHALLNRQTTSIARVALLARQARRLPLSARCLSVSSVRNATATATAESPEDLKSAKPQPPPRKPRSLFKTGLLVGLLTGLAWGAYDHGVVRLEKEGTVQPPTKCEPFPTIVDIKGTKFENVGVGVRTVSFMKLHVYAVGVYIASEDIKIAKKTLKGIEDLREKLYDEVDGVAIIDSLIEAGVRFAIRITPVKTTDFNHLRDGFVRSVLNNPIAKQISNQEDFGMGLNDLKQAFSRKLKAPSGDSIYMTAQPDGSMVALYSKQKEPETFDNLGTIASRAVARVFYLQYLSGKNPNSPTARDATVEGLVALI